MTRQLTYSPFSASFNDLSTEEPIGVRTGGWKNHHDLSRRNGCQILSGDVIPYSSFTSYDTLQ